MDVIMDSIKKKVTHLPVMTVTYKLAVAIGTYTYKD